MIPSICINFLQNRVENMLTRLTILCQNSKLTRAISKLKKHFKINTTFSFSPTRMKLVAITKDLQNNKAAGGEIPLYILKKSNFTFDKLTECVNDTLKNGKFPDSIKNAITPVYKKDDPTDK